MSVADIDMNRTTATRYCRQCLYDLAGLPENRCPECSTEFDPSDPASFLPSRSWLDRPRVRSVIKRVPVVISVLIVGAFVAIPLWSLMSVHPHPKSVSCQYAVTSVRFAIRLFESEHQSFPPNLEALVVGEMIEQGTGCPDSSPGSSQFGYCYVTELGPDDPSDWIILFDASCGIIQGTRTTAPHNDICNVAYVGDRTKGLSIDAFRDEFARFHADFVKARGHPPAIQCPAPAEKDNQ